MKKAEVLPKVGEASQYTQINVMFPSAEVELPPAEKFNAFPPEARAAILEAFRIEQRERHEWLKNQQKNDHELNMLKSSNYYRFRMCGSIFAGLIALVIVAGSIWLIAHGASTYGVSILLTAGAGLILSAIYGRQVASGKKQQKGNSINSSSGQASSE